MSHFTLAIIHYFWRVLIKPLFCVLKFSDIVIYFLLLLFTQLKNSFGLVSCTSYTLLKVNKYSPLIFFMDVFFLIDYLILILVLTILFITSKYLVVLYGLYRYINIFFLFINIILKKYNKIYFISENTKIYSIKSILI